MRRKKALKRSRRRLVRANPLKRHKPLKRKTPLRRHKRKNAPSRRAHPARATMRKNPPAPARRYIIEAYSPRHCMFYYLAVPFRLTARERDGHRFNSERDAHENAVTLRKSLAHRPEKGIQWVRARPV